MSRERESVSARPVKTFFVSMLTRDIKLEDAILDLLDNCVDGILRTGAGESDRPYEGFWANITFSADSFVIEDNCGGIPSNLLDYAFRLGRAPDYPEEEKPRGAVGVYGIGMKRAIFKMGESCVISTRSERALHEVVISSQWLQDEDDWDLPITHMERPEGQGGTRIEVKDLKEGIVSLFVGQQESFSSDLHELVATHYSFIIDKGFRISVNGESVRSRSRGFVYTPDVGPSERVIRPFTYRAKTDKGVEIFMVAGFNQAIPSEDETRDDQEVPSRSSEDAGWTVVCNDRAVLFCDRSELTGWGEAGVPRYHTQFIAFSGVVEFKCENPAELPTTTTKRGVDASSPLYLQVKNKMREGMRLFTSYTNQWKARPYDVREQFGSGRIATFAELKEGVMKVPMARTPVPIATGEQFNPPLPVPVRDESRGRRISFTKRAEDVRAVAEYLFDDSQREPSSVGEECFDIILQEARS